MLKSECHKHKQSIVFNCIRHTWEVSTPEQRKADGREYQMLGYLVVNGRRVKEPVSPYRL